MNNSVVEREFLLSEARLSTPPSEALIKYHDMPGLAREKKQYREFNDVDLAHTVMLAEQNILPSDENGGAKVGHGSGGIIRSRAE